MHNAANEDLTEALKSHPNAAESWIRPLLDTMSCNRSSKIKGAKRVAMGLDGGSGGLAVRVMENNGVRVLGGTGEGRLGYGYGNGKGRLGYGLGEGWGLGQVGGKGEDRLGYV